MTWSALAYPGHSLAPRDLWAAWRLELSLLAPMALAVLLYFMGLINVWKRAGAGHGISLRSCLRFTGAILALVVALASPLDALSADLFAAHMVQHLILILVAAPLLVMSDFPLALFWSLPRCWARALSRRLYHSQVLAHAWQVIGSPVCAWLLFALALWLWHASSLFEAALRNETVHIFEHLVFLTTAMLFWQVLIKRTRPGYIHYGMAIPYLFTAAMQSGILGALMIFSPQPWYAYYDASRVAAWGLTPLQDQQLAGLVMWLPGGAVFTLLTIGYFAAWFRSIEQRSVRL